MLSPPADFGKHSWSHAIRFFLFLWILPVISYKETQLAKVSSLVGEKFETQKLGLHVKHSELIVISQHKIEI